MKQSIQSFILLILASTWAPYATSFPEALISKTDYHHRILTVSIDGFKKLLSLNKEHLTAETIKKLEHALDDTQRLLMSDENNIVIVMVWNELVKNMLTYLDKVTLLKKHHLDKINFLLKEFQQWLTTYAEAHHSEGLIVQEVHHFIEFFKSSATDSTIIPYNGLTDRLEYAGHKCIEWSPLIISGVVILGFALSLKSRNQPAAQPSPHLRTLHTHPEDSEGDIIELWQKLRKQKDTFKPMGPDEATTKAIIKEFNTIFETLTTKEKNLASLLPLQRKALYQQLLKVENYMELHGYKDEDLLYIYSNLEDRKKQYEIIEVLMKRYPAKEQALNSLKETLKKEELADTATVLEKALKNP